MRPARAEDGYDLWLRYRPLPTQQATAVRAHASQLVAPSATPTQKATRDELQHALTGLLGAAPAASDTASGSALIVGTPASSPTIAGLRLKLKDLGREGYLIRNVVADGKPATVIAANDDIGALYGAFHYLRLLQTGQSLDALDIREAPRTQLRMLNHWDNLDRHVERGYAGESIWDWHKLPDYVSPRYIDYARANASIGINATVLNNVNASAQQLTPMYIAKAAALADVFRPYGIRVFLSARFSAPREIGGLPTADPLDPQVRDWWADKADEIYRAIPDFGGFLVKANSEGQPGPQDYGRTHADGANMMADAVKPHGGKVIWRAFVYSHETPDDRAKQAYTEFVPLDGRFRDNVMVQVKNGAIDFQPREPFHPLFGAMPDTRLMMEFQITKEYLGFATHQAYLGPMFQETLRADTRAGIGTHAQALTVTQALQGAQKGRVGGIAGVANIGSSRTWSGSVFDQANWYVFGRMAWDPMLDAGAVAREWAAQTFSPDRQVLDPVVAMMMASREAVVDYMTPLGLHHLMDTGHHHGPGPWVDNLERPDWNPVYYHRAGRDGIGFDRTARGSNAVSQYAPEVARRFSNPATTPPELLLWFHHLSWDYRMPSQRTLWEELVAHYDRGVLEVGRMQELWGGLRGVVDAQRWNDTAQRLAQQRVE
ncbi:alpha-glucuronidase family glycosyl hydrolase, partial [Lysobacter sp.]|uniref:alpha-glucuronidase family glycosyl hydrolase n=1 Tax=Lysobacter sp. TaxID=72226 RepID=UPI002D52FB8B